MNEKINCKANISRDSWGHTRKCEVPAQKDGFCHIHHPDAVRLRQKRQHERWDAIAKEEARQRERNRNASRYADLMLEAERVLEAVTYRSDFEPRARPAWYEDARALLAKIQGA